MGHAVNLYNFFVGKFHENLLWKLRRWQDNIKVDHSEICDVGDRLNCSVSCPVVNFGISKIESLDSTTSKLVSGCCTFFKVDGYDRDGFPLKRISPTAITGQSPGKNSYTELIIAPI